MVLLLENCYDGYVYSSSIANQSMFALIRD